MLKNIFALIGFVAVLFFIGSAAGVTKSLLILSKGDTQESFCARP